MRQLDLFGDLDGEPRYNVAPTQTVPIVRAGPDHRRTLSVVRWGLVPSWGEPKGAGFINARAETVAEKPAFRSAFKKRRCLILADGYFEWQAIGKAKQPYFIRRADDAPFGFAGLWECKPGEDGTALESCAVITTTASERTRSVHHRMPVILDPGAWDAWLAVDATPTDLHALMRPYPSEALAVDPVSPLVNNAKNDLPDCVRVVCL